MKRTSVRLLVMACTCLGAYLVLAEGKPEGFRFFENRLTIKPYVDLSYTYDSNIDTMRDAPEDNIFMVKPGADFSWRGDRWQIVGSIWYRYNYYCDYNDTMGENSYGESLAYDWTNVGEDGRGWNLILAERYAFISQADDYRDGGRGIWRDRETIDVSGVVERRFTERWHADVQGQYNRLDYDNDTGSYAPLYGWDEWSAGLQAGFVASKWTDLLVAGSYAFYDQESARGYRYYNGESETWSIQAGLGSHATEKITYRVLMGWSTLKYGGHDNVDDGWTYSLSANWRILRNLQWSALGSSYYQPSEREIGSAVKVYALSTGLSYLMFGDRLTVTVDVAWRYEDNVYADAYLGNGEDYDEDIVTYRAGLSYIINRWMSVYGNVSWENEDTDRSEYEYDRFRGTVGVRFHY